MKTLKMSRIRAGFSSAFFFCSCSALLVFVNGVFVADASAQSAAVGQGVSLQTQQRVATSELEDFDDYYFLASGKKVKLYRKKNTFVVRGANGAKARESMRRFEASYGNRVSKVTNHGFGNAMVVRIDNQKAAKTKSKQSFDISASMLKRLDSSVSNIDPVFSTASAQGDVMVLPRITFELGDTEQLATILEKYNLVLNRKLKLSADVYSTSINNASMAADKIFVLARQLSAEPSVAWAEPQFHFKPIKSAFTPLDPLFAKQWHLRDKGYRGSRCDTDCDADDAWSGATGPTTGQGTVIAVIDDGVQLNHPDLVGNIYSIPGEIANNNIDDDGNGYIDDVNGYDFVDDSSPAACLNNLTTSDGILGKDDDPSPRATANCEVVAGDPILDEDNHGTAVAGVIAALNGNSLGGVGVAFNAKILPVRAVSAFSQGTNCADLAEAFEYAAQHADVINASWQIPIECSALETSLGRVTSGNVTVGLGSKRDATGATDLGSPVIFASGNNASGWVKVTVPVSAGPHAYEWRFLRDQNYDPFFDAIDRVAWLDDITFTDSTVESFETISTINAGTNDFSTQWVLNSCAACTAQDLADTPSQPQWDIETDGIHVRSGSRSARISVADSLCGNSYLHVIKDGPAGDISFWVWVSADTSISDKFEFLVDGQEVLSYGDLAAFGFIDNAVAYPAELSDDPTPDIDGIIAVGASGNGDLSGSSSVLLASEERAPYSQYGPSLDVVAPGSNQHVGIVTTDRTGNDGFNIASSSTDLTDKSYTQLFMGTSASAAIVSGVSASVIATNGSLSAEAVKQIIRDTADEIGPVAYSAGRNDFHGHGRVNMFRALAVAGGSADPGGPNAICAAEPFDFSNANDLIRFQTLPQSVAFCPARGPQVPDDGSCYVIRTVNGNVAVFCL